VPDVGHGRFAVPAGRCESKGDVTQSNRDVCSSRKLTLASASGQGSVPTTKRPTTGAAGYLTTVTSDMAISTSPSDHRSAEPSPLLARVQHQPSPKFTPAEGLSTGIAIGRGETEEPIVRRNVWTMFDSSQQTGGQWLVTISVQPFGSAGGHSTKGSLLLRLPAL
jgi:hypothetical protein